MMINLSEPKQPSTKRWKFVKELSEPVKLHFNWTRFVAGKNEADLRVGVRIKNNFSCSIDNLETAFSDLNNFFIAAKINLYGNYEIIIEKTDTPCFEAYRLDIKSASCRIQANDSEGVRRAIYHLEDLLLAADGAFLQIGVIDRKPWLKSRISRCFFGPIKRPPLNRDELLDNIDYYPDEYLNRLAHESINGLWLTIAFSDLCKTSITQLDPDAKKRLDKLRRTVGKCLQYGIKTYIFCIEPRSMAHDNPMLINNPELKGSKVWDENYCFCPFSDIAQKYLYEATNWIFSQVPRLGGMINISYGERFTTCASHDFGKGCPVCSKKTSGEIIAAALKPMEHGMRDASSCAELISWLYVPQNGTGDLNDRTPEMLDIANKLPDNIILQYNFESGGSKKQLGKERHVGDYWLSYLGPSKKYKRITQEAKNNGKKISAKIQVACSHEIATVPMIPVPGLLYKKYKKMHKLGVSHVMQCWYFGSYPGIMNKAAGELAFEEFADTEEDFLRRMARPEWGKYVDQVVKAWGLFTDGYINYPLDNMFQYYGPMNDGVIWPLHLKPVDEPLAPTWKLEFGTSGDRYGECLGKFQLEEVLTLCAELSEKWNCGVEILRNLMVDSKECMKDIALAEALDIQFKSAYNILKFYALRDELLKVSDSHGINILNQMQEIVLKEIKNSTRMIELCKSDSRLGFHPEAEGYKYFPEKLVWRVDLLKNLLEKDFPQVKKSLITGKKAFAKKESKSYQCNSGKYEYTASFAWKADYKNGKLKVSIDNFINTAGDQFKIFVETKPFNPPLCIIVQEGKYETEIPVNSDAKEVAFNILKTNKSNYNGEYISWVDFSPLRSRLVLGNYNPHAMGSLLIGNNKKIKEEHLKLRHIKKEIVQV